MKTKIKYNIPGETQLTHSPITVYTDGGPWAHHNFPCPICHECVAVLELDGWVFQPCRGCQADGWIIEKRISFMAIIKYFFKRTNEEKIKTSED